jgi:predicted unusual protein kinase regulating ubiquinone biosynthesis (AarF/ABC1/UbiB family)
MTTRVSAEYLGGRIAGVLSDAEAREGRLARAHIRNAEKVVETMGRLKGAAMKVGQGLAILAEGADLPPEVAGILARLNDRAPAVPFSQVKGRVEEEIGPLEENFLSFDETPLGSASLGQAHGAQLKDGTDVVVKVLYRNIERSVGSDLAALRSVLAASRLLQRDKNELDAIFQEIRERLEEELDYEKEAQNLTFFKNALSDMDGVEVPAPIAAYSTKRVLTMERLYGVPLDRFEADGNPEATKRAGQTLMHVFFEMVYRHRALHADPHPGNYLFQPDGTVGLLDFGCVRRFEKEFVAEYARIGRAAVEEDRPIAVELAHGLGVLHGNDPGAEDLFWDFCDVIARPFRGGPYTAGAREDGLQRELKALSPRFLRFPEIRSPPELVYMHRALGGTYAMLRRLKTEADYGHFHRLYAAHAIGVAEGRIKDGRPVDLELGA